MGTFLFQGMGKDGSAANGMAMMTSRTLFMSDLYLQPIRLSATRAACEREAPGSHLGLAQGMIEKVVA